MPGVEVVPLDVCSDMSVKTCVDAVLSRAGRVDILVNNAGYVLAGAVEEISVEEAKAQFETNFFGAMRVVNAVVPKIRQQRNGQIINISSLAGLVPGPPFCGIYSASKYALEAYTAHLRREVRPFNIHVSVVEPGSVKTNLTRHLEDASQPIGDYEDRRRRALDALRQLEDKGPEPTVVADRVLRIVQTKSPKLRYRVGQDGDLVSRLHEFAPETVFERAMGSIFHLDAKS
jgi:short-subunit dehydrogenase